MKLHDVDSKRMAGWRTSGWLGAGLLGASLILSASGTTLAQDAREEAKPQQEEAKPEARPSEARPQDAAKPQEPPGRKKRIPPKTIGRTLSQTKSLI
jgi:hypothetical protein